MAIRIKALRIAQWGLDLELLTFPNPEFILNTRRHESAKVWYVCPSLAYVIDHPDGLILWETGISRNALSEWLSGWQELIDISHVNTENLLESCLKSIGLGPEDFRYVIMGHLHCDHAGGLRLFEHAPAEIICHEDEYRTVMAREEDGDFYVRADWNFLARKRPVTISGDQEILQDLWLHSLPGHTPGSMGLSARLNASGWMMLLSDALYSHHGYGPPAVGSPIVWNGELWRRSIEKIRRLATERDAFVLPGHDEMGIKHEAGRTELKAIQFAPHNPTYE